MNSNEDLKKLLASWTVDEAVPRRFQSDVWTRIAARESERRSWRDEIAALFHQPQMAAAAVALGLTVSVGAAYFRAQDSNAATGRRLETRYLQTINPLAHAGHGS